MKMDFLKEFNTIMKNTDNLALATAVDSTPNIRVINFYYDESNKGVIYFSSFKGSPKIKEFVQNNKVSFTTIPVGSNQHVRVTGGVVKESSMKLSELAELYSKKYPGPPTPQSDMVAVYEVQFSEAEVTLGINQRGMIKL